MAKVMQCDRCKKIYSENKKIRNVGTPVGVSVIEENEGKLYSYDLCDSCLDDFYDFMIQKE